MKIELEPIDLEDMENLGIELKEYDAEWDKGLSVNIGQGIEGDVKVAFVKEEDKSFIVIPDGVVRNIKMNTELAGTIELLGYDKGKVQIKVF